MQRAIVMDARLRMSLVVIRSLGKLGINVDATDLSSTPRDKSLGFFSRYTNETYSLQKPDDADYIERLKLICGEARPVLLPCGIDNLLKICEKADEISGFADIAVPSYESILLANDKLALMEHAKGINIPVPETTTLMEGETIDALANRVKFPVVIKYRAGELLHLDPQDRYKIIYDADLFKTEFERMHALQSFPLVQQYIEGDGYGISAVFDNNHNPIEVFCHKRIREYPISGGPSSMCESIWNDELANHAISLLRSLNWTGVAMVEFKGSAENGFYLMEINPRFWGSLALAPLSGCNIPYALYRAARGELAENIHFPTYKIGRKMQFILQDTLSAAAHLKRDKRISAFFGYLSDLLNPTVHDGVFSIHDLKSSLQYFKQALRKTDKIIR